MTTTLLPPPRPVADAEPEVLGERLLRRIDRGVQRLDRAVASSLAPALNPLAQAGAIANLAFLVAAITGALLLFWYVPSVHQAHASMRAIEAGWLASLVRTLHRYSSDACMLFVGIHALKIVSARRFTGPRWLAWVTGLLALALLGLIGWLGYWLVWDQPAQLVAQGSSRMLDVLPIFLRPFSSSFLTDATVNSLLFFVVFFAHMILPMAMVLALWLHLARLNRARWMPPNAMSWWVVGSLVGVSLLLPAVADAPARMAIVPNEVHLDLWYLAPLLLTERLGGGALWAALLVAGSVVLSVPWWMARRRVRAAVVEISRCNACTQCSQDCPYGAITMVPRTDGKDLPSQAQVDPARCVGCGICSGSCDSTGVGLDWFDVTEERKTLDRWLTEEPGAGIAFVCAHSVGSELHVDPGSGRCAELPGWRALLVPCAGWVHMLTVERCQRRGAAQVLIAACGDGDCRYREGPAWLRERLDGTRTPKLRTDRAERDKIHVVALRRGEAARLGAHAQALLRGASLPPAKSRVRRALSATVLWLVLVGATVGASFVPYGRSAPAAPTLVVSFEHAGAVGEITRLLSAEEQAALPVHMRRDRIVERRRAAVRLRIRVDGEVAFAQAYEPAGVWADGVSAGLASLPLSAGAHRVEVALGDSADAAEWRYVEEREVTAVPGERRVVLFERGRGFAWH